MQSTHLFTVSKRSKRWHDSGYLARNCSLAQLAGGRTGTSKTHALCRKVKTHAKRSEGEEGQAHEQNWAQADSGESSVAPQEEATDQTPPMWPPKVRQGGGPAPQPRRHRVRWTNGAGGLGLGPAPRSHEAGGQADGRLARADSS